MTDVVTAAQQAGLLGKVRQSLEAVGLSVLVVVCTGTSATATPVRVARRVEEPMGSAGVAAVAGGRPSGRVAGPVGTVAEVARGRGGPQGGPAGEEEAGVPVILLATAGNGADALSAIAAAGLGVVVLADGAPSAQAWPGRAAGLPSAEPWPAPAAEGRLAGARVGLTGREVEVLQAFANGATTVEVVRALFVSPKTVKNHLAHIYAKLGVADRTQAVARAFRLGIVHTER